MISFTDLASLKKLKKCSIIQFKFSKMDPEAAKHALAFLLKFLKPNEGKLLRLLGSKPAAIYEETLKQVFKLELLKDVDWELEIRKLQSFLVTFFTDDGVSDVKILDRKS